MLISDSNLLKQLCDEANKQRVIAIDTEFMRDKTYYPKISLIQIAFDKKVFAVDLLSNINPKPLVKLLSNPSIIKIIHSVRQDIEVLHYAFNVIPNNIFDTQIAAMFLGYKDPPSLEKLINDFLKIKLNKQFQFSNWLERPLSSEKIDYALKDAELLYLLFFEIKEKLNSSKLEKWIFEESNLLNKKEKFLHPPEVLAARAALGIGDKIKANSLLKLYKWREKKAQSLDVPRSGILKDETIFSLINKKKKRSKLFSEISTNKNLDETDMEMLLEILEERQSSQGEEANTDQINLSKLEILHKNDLFHMLKILLNIISEKSGVSEKFIATTNDILNFSNNHPSKIEYGWRKEIFGNLAQKLRDGKVTIGYNNGKFFYV